MDSGLAAARRSGMTGLYLALYDEVRLRLHQPFPFVDVFAHERLVGCGRRHDSISVGLDPPRDAKAAVHVNPFILEASEAALDLLEIGEVVDFAEIGELLLRAHGQ